MGNCGGRIISAVWEKQSANSDVVTNIAYISYMSDLKPGPGSRYVASLSLLQLEPRQFNLFLATTSENQECVLCLVVRILQILSPHPANTALICSGASAHTFVDSQKTSNNVDKMHAQELGGVTGDGGASHRANL